MSAWLCATKAGIGRAAPTIPRWHGARRNGLRFVLLLVGVEVFVWSFYYAMERGRGGGPTVLPFFDNAAVVDLIQPMQVVMQQQQYSHESQSESTQPSSSSFSSSSLSFNNKTRMTNNRIDIKNYIARHVQYVPPSSSKDFSSLVHCVGDNWEPTAYLFRSCQFRNLCWSVKRQEFLLISSPTQHDLDSHISHVWQHPYARISTMMKSTAQIITKQPTTNRNHTPHVFRPLQVLPMGQRLGIEHYKWFPTVVDDSNEKQNLLSNGYWRLNDNVVVIPLYLPTVPSTSSSSSSSSLPQPYPSMWSLLTESFYPMYTLLSMFQIMHNDQPSQINTNTTVLVQFLPPPPRESSCNNNNNSSSSSSFKCSVTLLPDYAWWQTAFQTFMSWHTLSNVAVVLVNNNNSHTTLRSERSSTLICAKRGVAGMGSLTDHGLHTGHGERGNDYRIPPQAGRGPQWWDFRNYIVLQQQDATAKNRDKHRTSSTATLSFQTILAFPSNILYGDHIANAIQQHFDQHYNNHQIQVGKKNVNVDNINASLIRLDREKEATFNPQQLRLVAEYIRLASQSMVFVAAADDFDRNDDTDTVEALFWPALFLPRGATLILYYDETKKVPIARGASRPRKVHYNVWNNLSYLKVHWLPLPKVQTSETKTKMDMRILISLIEMEMQRVQQAKRSAENLEVQPQEPADGKLNGINLYLKKQSSLPSSKLHCLGDNFHPWFNSIYQSCHIQNLCLDLHQPHNASFFIAPPDRHQRQWVDELLQWNASDASISTDTYVYDKRVTVGQIARFSKGSDWFPQVRNGNASDANAKHDANVYYYELPPNVVWLPFYAEQPNINNPGHLLWDFFLPMYTLRALFGLDDQKQLFLTNLDQECSVDSSTPCYNTTTKFLRMLGVAPSSFRSVNDMQLESNDSILRSNIVCVPNAVVGMGMLTDHGLKRHGQGVKDYRHVHNAGRGSQLYKFRNHVLRHMGFLPNQEVESTRKTKPFQAVFSINSSTNPSRRRDFARQLAVVRSYFASELSVQELAMARLPLTEQLLLITETSIFVSVVGGATSTAAFLSRGSCLILYFNDLDDFVSRAGEDRPSMMDWDFWNNASYLRVHWLPIKSMNEDGDLKTFRLLLQHEIHILSQ